MLDLSYSKYFIVSGSFRSSTTHQSSISEKIIHKLSSRNKKTSYVYQNSYHELEAAYVAQICLTWEALNWNYNYFQQLRASRRESDPGCPAYIAQQFQQFQVVLQRYIENEPYQNGRRPIVFARMRSIAPKLLQVPEYRDSDDEKKDEYLGSRISSESFLKKLKLKDLRRSRKCFRKRKSSEKPHAMTDC
ncbi:ribosomal protein L34Ae protein [Tanacetum coccineum]